MSRYLRQRRPRERCATCGGTGTLPMPSAAGWPEETAACPTCGGMGRLGDWQLPDTLPGRWVRALEEAEDARIALMRHGPEKPDYRPLYRLEHARAMALAKGLRLAMRDGATAGLSKAPAWVMLPNGRYVNVLEHYGLKVDPRPYWLAATRERLHFIKRAIDAGHVARVRLEVVGSWGSVLEVSMSRMDLEERHGQIVFARLYEPGTSMLVLTSYISSDRSLVMEDGRWYSWIDFGVIVDSHNPYISRRFTVIVPDCHMLETEGFRC